MEGIGQLVAPRAAAPDGGIPSPGRLSRRLKPVPARHAHSQFAAQFQNPSQFQNPAQLQNPAQFQNPSQVRNPAAVPSAAGGLDLAVAAMDALRSTAVADARSFGFLDAADFAGTVEEIARTVEFLQLVAAHAVERTRSEAQASRQPSAAPGWRTGWTEPAAADTGTAAADAGGQSDPATAPDAPGSAPGPSAAAAVDDGYRNAAEFLRARLRIGIGEARRRLALASGVLPQTGLTGQDLPARHELLAAALSTAAVPSRSATIISTALEQVRHHADPDTARQMEHSLTRTALESDPDFVHRTAKRWVDAIDQDGTEPGEEELRHRQGAFIRKPRHGLHHLEIFATAEQYETLATAMNTATNPRLQHTTDTDAADGDGAADTGAHPALDRRSRAQKLLDGLTGACAAALTTGQLPANGGLRPQVMVTIDYQDLLGRLQHLDHLDHLEHLDRETPTRPGPRPSSGASTFQGPIHPAIIRKIACDADTIPVLLGSDSRVLDIGRTTRIFPPHIRKAIIARDQGCAFPDCTIPAPWCEAHHITYWSQGGTTSTDNGTLLCSHHHVIHKEHWTITLDNGTAWFKPPPHLDPRQTPRRNHHFRPTRT
ncbi:HNH endonuclease signature motif containing protein [Arthrobacter sp. S2(2024)]|uniref:HNH endonuclease signature motif containing protein n=1 Tax=Arthrobacter sp. S2(2024) TaxID=3111911 RepID=UPI002FC5E144